MGSHAGHPVPPGADGGLPLTTDPGQSGSSGHRRPAASDGQQASKGGPLRQEAAGLALPER